MPTAALRPCPTCHEVGCTAHLRKLQAPSQRVQRTRGRRLQRLRSQLFDKQPLCVPCLAEDRVTVATMRDHVIPLAAGGKDVESNVQAICESCHAIKSREEAKRGIYRRYGID